ncbi:MAG TPA: hypothetical protein VKB92_07290 [Myxococcales bacterium]|nr:hypothetical protein [Myxococcales bacterium]
MAWTDPNASERWHSLDQDPAYAGKDLPGTHELTSYSPAGNGPKDEVYRVTASLSFIARTLFIIAEDKHFEDLTGEDALTIGVGDFAAGSDIRLLQDFDAAYPSLAKEAFGDKYDQVYGGNAKWLRAAQKATIKKDGSYRNDHGAIVNGWFRRGVGQLLADRRLYGVQLRTWRKDKVESSLGAFQGFGFKLQFSLAAMCGMANSMGPGGMKALVQKSLGQVKGKSGQEKEIAAMRLAVAGYASSGASFNADNGDKRVKAAQENAAATVAAIFDGGKRPGDPEHRALRMLHTGDWFPIKEAAEFDGDLGDFQLEEGEQAPKSDGATPPSPLPDRPLGDRNNRKWKRHKPEERKADTAPQPAPKADPPPPAQDPKEFLPDTGSAQPATVVEGGFDKIKVQLAPGGTDKPQRPTRSTQLVWGGYDPSTPWGMLAALIEKSGGAVQYTYLHAADLVRKRNQPFQPKDEESKNEEAKDGG